ncbi:MAG: hypothetical protein D8H94_08865 [Cardiobacterium sp.]|nr:MAG: hypothetical protein D8H94_08865 [Cardiobacterium sp.]
MRFVCSSCRRIYTYT